MKRREFITLLGGAAAAWPVAARAQQPAAPVVGWLSTSSSSNVETKVTGSVAAFRHGLSEAGYLEARNVAIEYRWAEDHYDCLPVLAADLVRRRVAVIATNGGLPSPLAAQAATSAIPIVFPMGADPVKSGLVASLNRPGGNITGVSILNGELGPKRLQVLHELVPMTNIALLVNPTNPATEAQIRDLEAAARSLGIAIQVLRIGADPDLEAIFERLAQMPPMAMMIAPDPFLIGHSPQLAALAARHRVPALGLYREFAASDGLASYAPSLPDAYRYAGLYVGRILKGGKPASLPVIQSARFELVINLKAARALGLNAPLSLLASADEVIE